MYLAYKIKTNPNISVIQQINKSKRTSSMPMVSSNENLSQLIHPAITSAWKRLASCERPKRDYDGLTARRCPADNRFPSRGWSARSALWRCGRSAAATPGSLGPSRSGPRLRPRRCTSLPSSAQHVHLSFPCLARRVGHVRLSFWFLVG